VHLAATHYKVGLATGSPTALAEHVLRITRLDRVFQATMYGDDVLHGKPAPDIYFAVLDKLGVAPARAVGVEDSGNGIRSLRAAGMAVVAAPGPNFPLSAEVQALAHVQIAHMGEFNLALVERAAAAARAETGGLAVAGRMVE
jgi:beta-phosphoglucomutase-like phosphatase (HAD superfamily)